MKNLSRKVFVTITLTAFLLPVAVFAQTPPIGSDQPSTFTAPAAGQPAVSSPSSFQLIPCSGVLNSNGDDPVTGQPGTTCDFVALMTTVQRFINLLLYATSFIAVILVVFAGFKYLNAGGNANKTGEAKKIISAAAIGMIIAFCSWVIVNTIVTKLGILNAPFSTANPLGQQ